nr:xylulose kinase-1 [Tanacetum cinerariifolium]
LLIPAFGRVPTGSGPFFYWQFLVHARELIFAGGCTLPAGSNSFLLWDTFLLSDSFLLDDHNKVAYLEKGKGWEAYAQVLNFLNRSHIRYALTYRPPMVFDSLFKQFWATTIVRTLEAGPSDIISTIDGNEVVVNESLIRTQLHLDDVHGLYNFTLNDVLDGMRAIRYPTYGSLTFYKAMMSPQSRFLIHTLIHCMSPKSEKGWNQVPSSLASALICLSSGQTYNFYRFIMDGMLGNVGSKLPACGDAAGAAANVAAGPGPSSAPQVQPVRKHTLVREPLPVRELTPVREPTLVREPLPHPEQKPTLDSPSLPSPPPSSAKVGPTTSSRPPSLSRPPFSPADIREGAGDFASSPLSNEDPQTPAATAAGGVKDSAALTVLTLKLNKCLHRVLTLETELGITKKVLGGAEFDLAALHTLASVTLGDDPSATAVGPDVDSTMPVKHTSITRRRLRKSSPGVRVPAAAATIPATSLVDTIVRAAAATIPAASSVDVAVPAAAGPFSSIPTNKGKAPMVDDSSPAALLELDAAQLIYTEADWLDMLAKIATNSALSKQLLGDDVTEENMNERLGMLLMHLAESHMDPPLTAPTHGSFEPTVVVPSPSSSRHRRKHLAKKRVTPIVDVADAAMINFDCDSDSDDDPLPYAPYASWEMVPSPLGSVHAYHNMAGHTKHFTTLREILHMVERTDLQRLLSAVDALYQSEDLDTFALLLWGDLHRMLKHGLEVSKLLVGGDLTMAKQLIGFTKAALLNAKSAA